MITKEIFRELLTELQTFIIHLRHGLILKLLKNLRRYLWRSKRIEYYSDQLNDTKHWHTVIASLSPDDQAAYYDIINWIQTLHIPADRDELYGLLHCGPEKKYIKKLMQVQKRIDKGSPI